VVVEVLIDNPLPNALARERKLLGTNNFFCGLFRLPLLDALLLIPPKAGLRA